MDRSVHGRVDGLAGAHRRNCAAVFNFFPKMAGDLVAGSYGFQLRQFLFAAFLGPWAPRMEVAARRRIDGAGHIARENDSLALLFKIWIREGDC